MISSLRLLALALASAAALSSSAFAQQPAQPPPAQASEACPPPGDANARIVVITKPTWVKRPDGDDVTHAYPPFALKQQKSDATTVDRAVADDGQLANCRVLSDKKPGLGFDKAALQLAKLYRMEPLSSVADFASLPDCIRKAGPPHVVLPMDWHP